MEIQFPGVYIEEVPFGVRSIEGVGTSTTAFLGAISSGPALTAVKLRTWAEYDRAFGSPDPGFELGDAVGQFFANGGRDTWVVGVPPGVGPTRGLEAFDAVSDIALLCLPGEADPEVLRAALAWADRRRAFLIVDAPGGEREEALGVVQALAATGSPNAAVYYPWVRLSDPHTEGALRESPPSGSVAGLYARTDRARGVWKAPAGVEAALVGIDRPAIELYDAEVGELTAAGVNCIRTVPGAGTAVWGARTVQGAEERGSQWKYVPVRRLALFLEESLHRGTQWVVFEPNDEPLWAKLRLMVGEFLDGLWRAGGFVGEKAEEAYFVRCGRDTMTQSDIENGRVNVVVGFAPLKPAEFVDVRIQQLFERVDTEVLGQGTGEPGWRLPLPRRAAGGKGLSLQVEEPGGWTTWTPVKSLAGAGPSDRVYTIERKDDHRVVVFGDGKHGGVPPAGSTIRVTYLSGGGRESRNHRHARGA